MIHKIVERLSKRSCRKGRMKYKQIHRQNNDTISEPQITEFRITENPITEH
jgi:hypothetical protein